MELDAVNVKESLSPAVKLKRNFHRNLFNCNLTKPECRRDKACEAATIDLLLPPTSAARRSETPYWLAYSACHTASIREKDVWHRVQPDEFPRRAGRESRCEARRDRA